MSEKERGKKGREKKREKKSRGKVSTGMRGAKQGGQPRTEAWPDLVWSRRAWPSPGTVAVTAAATAAATGAAGNLQLATEREIT